MIWRAAWLVATLVYLAGSGTAQTIQAARFTDPTTPYGHGVLGDAVEYGACRLLFYRAAVSATPAALRYPSVTCLEQMSHAVRRLPQLGRLIWTATGQ